MTPPPGKQLKPIGAPPLSGIAGGVRYSLGMVGLAVYPPGTTFGPRQLRDYEFVWIEAGDVIWHPDGGQVPAPAGTLLLCRPGMRDGFTWDPRHPTRHGFLHFSILEGQDRLPPVETWPLSRSLPPGDIFRPLLHHFRWLWQSRPDGWEGLAASALHHALTAYFADAFAGADPLPPPLHPLVERVAVGVEKTWTGGRPVPLSLGHLAQLAGVSRAHLARVFRRELGTTPVAALRELRLSRAASLLARTNLPVQAVAEATGFADPFHFTRMFTTRFGQSPRTFRTALAAGADMPPIRIARVADLARRVWR